VRLSVMLLVLLLPSSAGLAQSGPESSGVRPGAVAVLDVALYTAGANVQQASDTGRAGLATSVLRGKL